MNTALSILQKCPAAFLFVVFSVIGLLYVAGYALFKMHRRRKHEALRARALASYKQLSAFERERIRKACAVPGALQCIKHDRSAPERLRCVATFLDEEFLVLPSLVALHLAAGFSRDELAETVAP